MHGPQVESEGHGLTKKGGRPACCRRTLTGELADPQRCGHRRGISTRQWCLVEGLRSRKALADSIDEIYQASTVKIVA
jgi:hypothetical protein